MSAGVKVPAALAMEVQITKDQIDFASVSVSWTDERIMPMIQAIAGLADFSSADPRLLVERLKLVHSMAKEAAILVDEATHYFETAKRNLEAKLVQLEGGAA